MFPMGDEHVVADGFVAIIHCLFEGWDVLREMFFNNLTEHFPVLGNMIICVLLSITDSPVTGDRENDVVFLQKLFQIRKKLLPFNSRSFITVTFLGGIRRKNMRYLSTCQIRVSLG